MSRLPPLSTFRTFEAAARHLSFKRAAAELGVTSTAVSHQIKLLEEDLGTSLFVRRVREVQLTPAGTNLYPPVRESFNRLTAAVAAIRPKGRAKVTLSATPLFLSRWLVPRIDRFRRLFPEADLRLIADLDLVDLAGGEADAAVRYGRGPFPGLSARRLARDSFLPMCSPRLNLGSPSELARYDLLHCEWRLPGPDAPSWHRWGAAAGLGSVDWSRGVTVTDETLAIEAAIAGKGVALLSPLLLANELASGMLVSPFGPTLPGPDYYFVHLPDERDPLRCERLWSWLAEGMELPSP